MVTNESVLVLDSFPDCYNSIKICNRTIVSVVDSGYLGHFIVGTIVRGEPGTFVIQTRSSLDFLVQLGIVIFKHKQIS